MFLQIIIDSPLEYIYTFLGIRICLTFLVQKKEYVWLVFFSWNKKVLLVELQETEVCAIDNQNKLQYILNLVLFTAARTYAVPPISYAKSSHLPEYGPTCESRKLFKRRQSWTVPQFSS
jgi:hypothetical protein